MRVTEVYKDVHPFTRGGIERYIHDLSVQLASGGSEVTVLVASDGLPEGCSADLDGFSVSGYPCMGRLLSTPLAPGLSDVFRGVETDVFHFHLPLPNAVISWLLSGRKSPYVVTYHSDIVRQALLLPLYGPFLRRFLTGANQVLATSAAYVRSSKWLSGLDNVSVVPIGADPLRFRPASEEHRAGRGDYALFTGRFRSYKGIRVLLEAWRNFPTRPLVLAGGGPMREEIIRTADSGKLNIRLVEDPTDDELVLLYRGARCLILPSIHRSEAFGMVQVEAMACGTPVISTNLPTGVPWVNENNVSGLTVTYGDASALAEAVLALDDDALRDRLAAGALSRASAMFNGPELLGRVETVLRRAAAGFPDR